MNNNGNRGPGRRYVNPSAAPGSAHPGQPGGRSANQPGGSPANQSGGSPANQPGGRPANQPGGYHRGQPDGRLPNQNSGYPVNQPVRHGPQAPPYAASTAAPAAASAATSKAPLLITLIAVAIVAVVAAAVFATGNGPAGSVWDTGVTESSGDVGADIPGADIPGPAPATDGFGPYTVYSQKIDEFFAGDSISFNVTSEMNMNVDGESMALTGNGSIKMVDMRSAQPQAEFSYVLGADGQPVIDISFFSKDGYAYTEMWGIKSKMAIAEDLSVDSMMSQAGKEFQKIESDDIIEASESRSAGVTVYMFKLRNDAADLVEEYAMSMPGETGVDVNSMNIDDISSTVEIDDAGMLLSQTLHIKLSIEADGQSGVMEVTERYDNFETSGVTINYPPDLDEYTEISNDYDITEGDLPDDLEWLFDENAAY
jgi:hypothetical protein